MEAPRRQPERHGLAILICGPSGVGKSTLVQRLMQWDPSIRFSVSMSTRMPRPGELHGREYLFVDHDEFMRAAEAGELLESAIVHDEMYGTPAQPIAELRGRGYDVLLDIDVQGAQQIRLFQGEHAQFEAVFVLIQPPSIEVLAERLRARRTESDERFRLRLASATEELAKVDLFDYAVVNDDLGQAFDKLCAIVTAERCRVRDGRG